MATLYYSERCQHCKSLLQIIQKKSLTFKMANVDFLVDIPDHVQHVPTLITHERKVLTGKAAFDYLDSSSNSNTIDVSQSVNYSNSNDGMMHIDVPSTKMQSDSDYVYLNDSHNASLHPINSSFHYMNDANPSVSNVSSGNGPPTSTSKPGSSRNPDQLNDMLSQLKNDRT